MRHTISFLLLLTTAISLLSCTSKNQPSVSITLSDDQLHMKVGDMKLLQAKASNGAAITWTSSNSEVASVSDGVVDAKSIGSAIIKVETEGASASCYVYVLGKNDESIGLSPAMVQLEKGETYQYSCSSAYGITVTWSSSNPDIVSVNSEGLVTALKAGTSLITATDGMETVSSRVLVPHHWGEYELVWEENFDGSELNETDWNIEVNGNPANREQQYYTNREENVRLENGNLILEARKEAYGNRYYTSGRINTKNKKSFLYGKIEARISFPSGGGTWPAFWMLGQSRSWPSCGEIDIVEHVGNQPSMVSFAVHTLEKNGNNGKNFSARVYKEGVENEYHIYGVEWIPEDYEGRDRIIFTYDGEVQTMLLENEFHIDEDYYWPFNQPFYIILNLAIGGSMGGTINDEIFENPILMKVDWVRVYQRNDQD